MKMILIGAIVLGWVCSGVAQAQMPSAQEQQMQALRNKAAAEAYAKKVAATSQADKQKHAASMAIVNQMGSKIQSSKAPVGKSAQATAKMNRMIQGSLSAKQTMTPQTLKNQTGKPPAGQAIKGPRR